MKVTKEELIKAFNTTVEKESISFGNEKESLKLVLADPNMTSREFENVVCWLTEILFSGANLVHVNNETTLTGVIFLNKVISHSKKLIIVNSNLSHTSISDLARCMITDSKLQDSSITSCGGIGSVVAVKYSDLIGCDLIDSFVDYSSIVSRGIPEKTSLENCHVAHSRLFLGSCVVKDKKFSSVIIDASQFSGDYFSIGLNGETATGYINGTEKVIALGDKKYNLGSWEEQFIKKEQNQFIKMVNQKKLEMMNMFFDSLMFKK